MNLADAKGWVTTYLVESEFPNSSKEITGVGERH